MRENEGGGVICGFMESNLKGCVELDHMTSVFLYRYILIVHLEIVRVNSASRRSRRLHVVNLAYEHARVYKSIFSTYFTSFSLIYPPAGSPPFMISHNCKILGENRKDLKEQIKRYILRRDLKQVFNCRIKM